MTDLSTLDYCQTNKKNTRRLAFWTSIWLITMAVVNFGPKYLWGEDSVLTLIAIAVNLSVGLVMIWSNKKHLMGLDELQQRIQLEAMGVTLGIGLVVGLAYSSLDAVNLIAQNAEITHLVMLMAVTYFISVVIGVRRYQ
ncbi:hypothetical protein [Idiomarina sp. HP20-50]|uniref:hypothetical protein n=1 Tax=Idiomarina sp. HP20-50 TaxID=3070813 RepID=UPI00294B8DF2|nr:hypothetical protein [Idiomarina sp. HP20-50]MDV6315744.1 hypothetical protein [Idiomarina sp. HP20-50]